MPKNVKSDRNNHNLTLIKHNNRHSFPWVTEFRAELRILPFSAEFWYFRGISRNFANTQKWQMISTVIGFTSYLN